MSAELQEAMDKLKADIAEKEAQLAGLSSNNDEVQRLREQIALLSLQLSESEDKVRFFDSPI